MKDLKMLYKEVKQKTRNFTVFNPEVLAENPKCILILRLLVGIGQNEAIRVWDSSVGEYEYGRYRRMQKAKAERLMQKIREDLRKVSNFSFIKVKRQFREFSEIRKEMQKRGLGALQGEKKKEVIERIRAGVIKAIETKKYDIKETLCKAAAKESFTDQEKRIKEILEALKSTFEYHKYVSEINVDFVLPNSKIPRFVILATEMNGGPYSWRMRVTERLSLRSLLLKKRNPKLNVIGVITGVLLTPAQKKLLNECLDCYFSDLNEFSLFISRLTPQRA